VIRIERYKNTRHWAVWIKDELVAVVCYKKGAQAIKQLLGRVRAQKLGNNPDIEPS
jgi:hypothetical protein